MTRYQLSLSAINLRKISLFRRSPSTFAVVVVTGGPSNGTEIGRTRVMPDTTDPDWIDTLYVDTDTTVYMPIRVDVYHQYTNGSEKLIAGADFEVMEIYQSSGHIQSKDVSGSGMLFVTVQESIQGDLLGRIDIHIRGLDIRNIEPGLLGLGRSDPFFELAKKNADYATGIVRFDTVYRSPHIPNHLNPFWPPFHLTTEELAFCNPDTLIRIAVKDHQKNGKHRLIGQVETTLKAIMSRVAVRGNADREKALDIFGNDGSNTGKVVILKASAGS